MKVTMKGISKAFGPVRVLDDIDFSIAEGEIHALMGENGAGKSTLMKILSGAYSADGGSILIDGKPVTIRSTREAEALGIAIIHQELNMIPQLSVMDNLFLGREPNRFGVIEGSRMHSESARWLNKVGAGQIDINRTAATLSIGLQQLVEIAKALSLNARVLIMDEPTASLTEREIGTLFGIMTELKSRGVGIVYVSHRMEEIFKICDKVSVLRDGHFVGERVVAQSGFDEVVKMMVGRELREQFPKRDISLGCVRLKVDGLADEGHISGIRFEVRSGEVLGVAGLIGAGRSRILNTLFGVNRRTSGEVLLDGKRLSIERPADAIAAGIGFVTEDRKSQGLVLGLSLRENVTLVHLGKYASGGIIDRKAEDAAVKALMRMTAQQAATLQKYGPLLALVAVCGGLAFMSPNFLTVGNSFDVMRQVSINAVIAFGMTLSILLGGIDLSVGSILALSSVLAAMTMKAGHGAGWAAGIAILAGAGMGSLNGAVIAKGSVAPFIATLGMMTLLRGVALVLSNGVPISGFSSDFFSLLGGGYAAGLVPVPVVLMLAMFAAFWFLLTRTVFGRHVYATGGNPEGAKLSGVNTDRVQILVYTLSGAMAALAGVILTSRLDSAQPTAGVGYELDAITAVVLGGTSLSGGRGWIFGTLVGALLIGVLNNGLNLMGVSAFYQQVVKGSVILLAVLLDRGGKS